MYVLTQYKLQVNLYKTIYLNYRGKYEDMIDEGSYMHILGSYKLRPEKNCLNRIRTHELCGTGVMLYQLSCQAN